MLNNFFFQVLHEHRSSGRGWNFSNKHISRAAFVTSRHRTHKGPFTWYANTTRSARARIKSHVFELLHVAHTTSVVPSLSDFTVVHVRSVWITLFFFFIVYLLFANRGNSKTVKNPFDNRHKCLTIYLHFCKHQIRTWIYTNMLFNMNTLSLFFVDTMYLCVSVPHKEDIY